jgi:hypothetical protein
MRLTVTMVAALLSWRRTGLAWLSPPWRSPRYVICWLTRSAGAAASWQPSSVQRSPLMSWPALLSRLPSQEALQASRLGPDVCGLALEHLLQVTYRPIMNSRRRSTTGGWRVRQVESSRSR